MLSVQPLPIISAATGSSARRDGKRKERSSTQLDSQPNTPVPKRLEALPPPTADEPMGDAAAAAAEGWRQG